MKKLIIVSLALSFLSVGCAMRTKILDASMVSMTRPSLAPNEKVTEKGPVSGRFCPDMSNDRGSKGLIDMSVRAAQEQNKVDFISNVSLWAEGNGCVAVEGTGLVVTK